MDNKSNYKKASRWITVNLVSVTARSRFYDYGDKYSEDANGRRDVFIFRHGGRVYALDQFLQLSAPIMFEDEDGKLTVIGGYDATEYYHPFLLEVHPNGESVRLWEEITK